MDSAHLLASLSYAADLNCDGCYFHSWRMALVAERLAQAIAPEERRNIFFGALMQDIGAVGAQEHIMLLQTNIHRNDDLNIKLHPQKSAAIMKWLPGMTSAADYVGAHHRWWKGRRREDRVAGEVPTESQVLCLVDTASRAGCFRSPHRLAGGLHKLAKYTGRAWSHEIWFALMELVRDGEFFFRLMNPADLPSMISEAMDEIGIPPELDTETGATRVLHVFAALVDLKDQATMGHSLRTADYAKALAAHMELPEEDVQKVYKAGLVHDCGRLGIPTPLLNKSGRLNDSEMDIIRTHARMTIRALNCIPRSPEIAELGYIAGHDHERFDGRGYPDGLYRDDIPLLSRVLSVADAFDSMLSSTEYRVLSKKGALMRLGQNAGTQFDPDVVEAMVSLVRNNGLPHVELTAA